MSFQGATLHGSQRADFPHWALASGPTVEAVNRIGMHDARDRQPAAAKPLHLRPGDVASLTAPGESPVPETLDLAAEGEQRAPVQRDCVVLQVPVNDRAQPRACYRDGVVPTTPEFGFHLPHPGRRGSLQREVRGLQAGS
jgi:hypothetical protein